MWVIYKEVGDFTYYLRIKFGKETWYGITDNATKFESKSAASKQAESFNLNPTQIKKI